MRRLRAGFSLALLCAAAAGPGAFAQATEELRVVVAARRAPGSEQVEVTRALVTSLLRAGLDQPLRVSEWPLAPGLRGRLELRRFEIYSPGAQLLHDDGGRKLQLPRSRLLFFEGRSKNDASVRVLVWLDPATRRLGGFADSRAGRHHLVRAGGGRRYRVTREAELPALRNQANWSCGVEPDALELEKIRAVSAASTAAAAPAITTLHYADVAIDTDVEFMALKFANDTTAASNYIAALLASMSVMYERDLKVRLRQGFTILRTSAAGDPYTQLPDPVSGGATFAQLTEFTDYWKANYAGVARTVAMMLSGKQPQLNFASGIAWVGGLCSKDFGYSFYQVFKQAGSNAASDSKLAGHELGHNFGSQHSHCYELDDCYSCENCGTDTLLSCPAAQTMNGVANVKGTVMSYCHAGASACSAGGCTSSEVFHPTTVANVLNPAVEDAATAPNQCIFPAAAALTKFFTLAPCRLLDTSAAGTPIPVNGERTFTFAAGACGIPDSALSLSANFTIPNPASAGYLRAYPADIGMPNTIIQDFQAGKSRANNGILKLAGRSFKLYNGSGSPLHVIVDVNGYFAVSP